MATFVSSSRATAAGRPPRNQAGVYAHKLMRAETAMGNAQLWADFQLLTNGQAVYLPGFVCGRGDFDLMQALTRDLTAEMTAGTRGQGMVNWSQHFKHENPDFSPTFRGIVQRLAVSVPPPMLVSPLQHACVPPLCAERPNRCRQGLGNRQENLPPPLPPPFPFPLSPHCATRCGKFGSFPEYHSFCGFPDVIAASRKLLDADLTQHVLIRLHFRAVGVFSSGPL